MSFVRDAVSVLTTQLLIAPAALITSIVLARLLSVHDRGLYAVATELAALAVILAQLGWPSASIYRLRRERAAPDAVASAALCVWLGVSLFAVGVCLVFRETLLTRLFPQSDPLVLYLALAIIPFHLLGTLFIGVARGLDRFSLHNAYHLLLAVLSLIAIAGALHFGKPSATVALTALLCVHVLVALKVFILVLRHSGLRLRVPSQEIRGSTVFGLKTYAQNVLLNVHQRLDIFIIAYLLKDPEPVALYAIAVGLVNRTRIVPNSIAMTMFPTVAALEGPEAARFVARVSRHSLFWMTVTVLVLAPAAPLLVPLLYGSQYVESVVPFLLLLPATVALMGYMVIARYFTARNRQQVNIATQATATAANVALNFALVPRYGIVGAGLASLISYSLQGGVALLAFSRESGEGLRACLFPDRSDLLAYRRQLGEWSRRLRATPPRPASGQRNDS